MFSLNGIIIITDFTELEWYVTKIYFNNASRLLHNIYVIIFT